MCYFVHISLCAHLWSDHIVKQQDVKAEDDKKASIFLFQLFFLFSFHSFIRTKSMIIKWIRWQLIL